MNKGISSPARRLLVTNLKGSFGTLVPPLVKAKQTKADSTEAVTGTSQQTAAFPWREAEPKDHGFLRLWHDYKQLKHKLELDDILRDAIGDGFLTYSKEEFIPGAAQAFAACTDAIFEKRRRIIVSELTGSGVKDDSSSTSTHATVTKPVMDSNNTDTTQEHDKHTESPEEIEAQGEELDPSEGDELNPKDIMGEALAGFYIEAMATAGAGHKVFYTLDEVVHVEIGDIFCDKTAAQVNLFRNNSDTRALAEKVARGASLVEELDRRMIKADVKIDVELTCRELFYVKDAKTDVILQGSEATSLVNHRLTLESTITGSLSREALKRLIELWISFRVHKMPVKDAFSAAYSIVSSDTFVVFEGPEWICTNIDDWIPPRTGEQ